LASDFGLFCGFGAIGCLPNKTFVRLKFIIVN
jgi:hypothetical protein